jgi:hypothetical protein
LSIDKGKINTTRQHINAGKQLDFGEARAEGIRLGYGGNRLLLGSK